jgi:hypothetical protein
MAYGRLMVGVVAVAIGVSMAACNGPYGNLRDTDLRVTVDGATCPDVGPVLLFVDGAPIGSVSPGNGVTQTVSIGDHTVSARRASAAGWTPQIVTVPQSGYIYTFVCQPNNQPFNPPSKLG